MKVTVCELSDEPAELLRDWDRLANHVQSEASDLVLLPEMIFCPWFGWTRQVDPAVWEAAITAHDEWIAERLSELAPAVVLGSRPVNRGGKRLNEGFVWTPAQGYQAAHAKYYLPDEEGFWEASWYQRGEGDFTPIQSGPAQVGFAICTELWFMERARAYGRAGIHLLATPRTTGLKTVEKWLVGGRAAAVVSGAFSASSNRVKGEKISFGGQGWLISPDGQVLGLTSPAQPFVTVSIDLAEAERAKQTYPRYVVE
jgi:N-carbamoylputrescine amidase